MDRVRSFHSGAVYQQTTLFGRNTIAGVVQEASSRTAKVELVQNNKSEFYSNMKRGDAMVVRTMRNNENNKNLLATFDNTLSCRLHQCAMTLNLLPGNM